VNNAAWEILLQQHRELEGVDWVRFTFEIDESA
jgi:hypothetical protein